MALLSSVGITVGVSAVMAATHDAAGMGALTFTPCGKLSAPPPMSGAKEFATFDNLSTGDEEKLLDMYRAGNGELSFGYDEDDTGQAALKTAFQSNTDAGSKVTLEFTLPNGTIYYRTAGITSYAPSGNIGNVLMAAVGCEFYKREVIVTA